MGNGENGMKRTAAAIMALAIACPVFAVELDSRRVYTQLDASLELTIELGSRCKKELFKYSKALKECRLFTRMLVVYLPDLEDWGRLTDAEKDRIYLENGITSDFVESRINKTGKYIEWIRAHIQESRGPR